MVLEINPTGKRDDYYFSVLFITEPESNQGVSILLRYALALNVLYSTSVSPAMGTIGEFSSPKIVFGSPVRFNLRVNNNSQAFQTVKGNITIKNMFGQVIGQPDIQNFNVLGNSNRSQEITWSQNILFGAYQAKASVALSPSGPMLERTTTFLAIPIRFVIGVLLIILAFFIFLKARRKNRA